MRFLLIALVALAVLPASAGADTARSLRVADAYWGPHPCAGKVQVEFDATLLDRDYAGEAIGLHMLSDTDWYLERCAIAVMPGMPDEDECRVIWHEVGHLVRGPSHAGVMSYSNDGPHACYPPLRVQIQRTLPARQAPWRITCGYRNPRTQRTRCKASSPRARYVRSYVASIAPDHYVRSFWQT